MLRNIRIGMRSTLFFGLLGLTVLLLGISAITQQNQLSSISNELGLSACHRYHSPVSCGVIF